MKTALMVFLMVVGLTGMVSALELVDDTEYRIASDINGYAGVLESTEVDNLQAGSGISLSDETYVIVLTEWGTEELVAKSILDESANLEGATYRKIGACLDDNGCYKLAQSYCSSKSSNLVARQPNSQNTGTNCYLTQTQIKTESPGYCNAECLPSQQAGVCTSTTCKNTLTCQYGTERDASCSNNKCTQQHCFTYSEAKQRGYVNDNYCTAGKDDTAVNYCDSYCDDRYGDNFAVTAAKCSSSGEPICGCTAIKKVECKRDADCNNYAIARCTTLAKVKPNYPDCDIQWDCHKNIIAAVCNAPCVSDPTKYTPAPDQPPTFVCGNGNCEGGETQSSCSLDCGTATVHPECVAGAVSEFKCAGGTKLLQKTVFSNCVEQWNVIQDCPEVCQSGACVSGVVQTIPGSTSQDPHEGATIIPSQDDPLIVEYCGDGKCDTASNEDKTCSADCLAPTTNGIGGGGLSSDQTTQLLIAGGLLGGAGLIIFAAMKFKLW